MGGQKRLAQRTLLDTGKFVGLLMLQLLAPIASGSGGEALHAVEGRLAIAPVKASVASLSIEIADIDVVLSLHGNALARHTAAVRDDGTFVLHSVPPGTHQLVVRCAPLVFPTVHVHVPPTTAASVSFTIAGTPSAVLQSPLVLDPVAKAQYTEESRVFSLKSLLSNPIYLMIGVSLLGMLFLPRMLENMDPQELESMKNQMGASSNQGNAQSNPSAASSAQAQPQLPSLTDLLTGKTSLSEMQQQMEALQQQQQSNQQHSSGLKGKQKAK